MDVYIECPVCEEQFYSPDRGQAEQVVCPGCSRQFALTSEVRIEPPLLKPAPKPASPTMSSRLARQATFEKPGSVAESPEELLPEMQPPDPAVDSAAPFTKPKLAGTTEIRNRYQRRNKRKLVFTLVTGGMLAAVIGILSGLLVMQLQRQSQAAKNSPEDSQADPANDDPSIDNPSNVDPANADSNNKDEGSPEDGPDVASSARQQKGADKKTMRLSDLPPQELEFLSLREIDECWETVQPHLVSLLVTDARGIHKATGTIVDSRGWILTSYNAIEGASKIEVTASAKTIDELPSDELLSDLVRGVVALDPENDLALLSINRRFVISFADISVAESNRIVEGEYLVQCEPPSNDNPYARTESKILIRDRLDALDASGQAQAKRRKLTNPDNLWLVALNDTAPLPGTPLVRPDGTVAGINVFSEKGSGFFLPVDHVKALIESATDEIEPLTVLGGSTHEEGQLITIADSHPMRDVSERLNQLGDACQRFSWIPQTEPQFNDLQKFTEQVATALIYVMENADSDDDEVEQIQTLVTQWNNTLTKRMANLNSDDVIALREMNKFAKKELRAPSRFVPLYGKVYLGGIDLADKLILRFDVDPTFVNIPFEPSDDDPMLPGSQWLFFVKTPAASRTVNFKIEGEAKPIPTFSADLQFAIGPTN